VFIATPNHHHALPAMMAMQLGNGVYCEKPVSHDIAESRRLREMARQYKVATQMGNQGHCEGGYRSLCEYIWAGVIGNVTETHSWTNRANGGVGPRPPYEKPPVGMDWDQWIGPAPYRDFHTDLHPHEWHGWYDFGNGSVGDFCCHAFNLPMRALDLDYPTHIEISGTGLGQESFAKACTVKYHFPARGKRGPVKLNFYTGGDLPPE
jgi:predicted dehydrogenase